MMWHGPSVKQNRPEARKHTLIIKNSADNFYLRERGITCLANHEIGTHYVSFDQQSTSYHLSMQLYAMMIWTIVWTTASFSVYLPAVSTRLKYKVISKTEKPGFGTIPLEIFITVQ